MYLLPIGASFICALFIIYNWKRLRNNFRNYTLLQKLPGPPCEGIVFGNVSYLCETADIVFKQLRIVGRNFYPIYKFYALHEIGANVLSPEDSELILSNPLHNEKGKFYKVLHKWLRSGLLTSNGVQWQTRRKILTPAFHFNILRQFTLVFNEEAEKLVRTMKRDGDYVNVTKLMSNFTLKIITETAMGTKLEFQTQKEQEYKKSIHEIGKILLYRILHPWCIEDVGNLFSPYFCKERELLKTLHNFTRDVITTKEKQFEEKTYDVHKGIKRPVMLDLLLSAKRNEGIIDDEGIQEEVDTFMFEGHDTISTALSFTLMLLANNRSVQERIIEEMKETFNVADTQPTYNDLQNLKYMERCIKESLRLFPSVHFITRHLGKKLTTHSGYLLPKGAHVAIHIYDIHHNPDIYPDPEKYDPDRFLPENSQKRHPFAYLPFSAGQRNCIGQRFAMLEMKVVLCAILSKYVLEAVDTPKSIVLLADIVLRSKDDIRVKFIGRS